MKTSINRSLSLVFGLVLALSCSGAEETAPMFRDLSFEAALKQAATEQKFVFVDFYTTWCGPCKMLDQTTWKDASVTALISAKAIPLKIDAEKELELAKRYKISAYPTLLLVKPDGTEIDRIIGFREPEPFKDAFGKVLALASTGKSSTEVAREAVDSADAEEAKPRFELAQKLARAGDNEKALALLVWCWDEGKKDPDFARTRTQQVPYALGILSRDYPPAHEALVVRRDQSRQRVIDGKGGKTAVEELIALNKQLREDNDTIAVLDKVPAGDERRTTFSIFMFDKLVEAKRYKDAYWRTASMSAMSMLRMRASDKRMAEGEAGEMMRASTIRRTAMTVEMLAGSDHEGEARDVMNALLEYDHSPSTRALLKERLEKARHAEWLPTEPEAPATKT
jgi:thioredoxin-like negative regulator of GroEL